MSVLAVVRVRCDRAGRISECERGPGSETYALTDFDDWDVDTGQSERAARRSTYPRFQGAKRAMRRNVILKGDRTTRGGIVVEGVETVTNDGRPVAYEGRELPVRRAGRKGMS